MKILITYIIIASIVEAILLISGYKKIKKAIAKDPTLQMVVKQMMLQSSVKILRKFWNWYVLVFVGTPLLIILSPFLFPSTLYNWLKKLIFGKSKTEKAAEAEMKAAELESKKFMETEGCLAPQSLPGEIELIPSHN